VVDLGPAREETDRHANHLTSRSTLFRVKPLKELPDNWAFEERILSIFRCLKRQIETIPQPLDHLALLSSFLQFIELNFDSRESFSRRRGHM
jgi:hypothetical protein